MAPTSCCPGSPNYSTVRMWHLESALARRELGLSLPSFGGTIVRIRPTKSVVEMPSVRGMDLNFPIFWCSSTQISSWAGSSGSAGHLYRTIDIFAIHYARIVTVHNKVNVVLLQVPS